MGPQVGRRGKPCAKPCWPLCHALHVFTFLTAAPLPSSGISSSPADAMDSQEHRKQQPGALRQDGQTIGTGQSHHYGGFTDQRVITEVRGSTRAAFLLTHRKRYRSAGGSALSITVHELGRNLAVFRISQRPPDDVSPTLISPQTVFRWQGPATVSKPYSYR